MTDMMYRTVSLTPREVYLLNTTICAFENNHDMTSEIDSIKQKLGIIPVRYYELSGSRHYEYRYIEDGDFLDWTDGGPSTLESLEKITKSLKGMEYEVREVCEVANDEGTLTGELIFSKLVAVSYFNNTL